jgi:hypothetical protein
VAGAGGQKQRTRLCSNTDGMGIIATKATVVLKFLSLSERSAARLAHQSGGLGVASSNLAAPTNKIRHSCIFGLSNLPKNRLGRLWEDSMKEHRALRAAQRGRLFHFRQRGLMSEATGMDRVWRYKPVAQSLGISTKTLQRLIARGEIATVHITDRIRGITESERARFVASRTMGGA